MRLVTSEPQLWTSESCYEVIKGTAATALNTAEYVEVHFVPNQINTSMLRKTKRQIQFAGTAMFPGGRCCELELKRE